MVTLSNYFNFLVFGDSSSWKPNHLFQIHEIVLLDLARVTAIKNGPNAKRVIQYDGGYQVDGCLQGYGASLVVSRAMQAAMKNTALLATVGTAILGAAKLFLQQRVRVPYIPLALLSISLTGFAFLRSRQARKFITEAENETRGQAETLLKNRKKYFAGEAADSKVLHRLEGESLFKVKLKRWLEDLQKLPGQLEDGKSGFVKMFFEIEKHFEKYINDLNLRCLNPLENFNGYIQICTYIKNWHNTVADLQGKQTVAKMAECWSAIQSTKIAKAGLDSGAYQHYCELAYIAALPQGARAQWAEIIKKIELFKGSKEAFYEETQEIVKKLLAYLNGDQGTSFNFQQKVSSDGISNIKIEESDCVLDHQWFERAKQMKVEKGDQQKYEQFLKDLAFELQIKGVLSHPEVLQIWKNQFSKWVQNLLDQSPKTPTEKRDWMRSFTRGSDSPLDKESFQELNETYKGFAVSVKAVNPCIQKYHAFVEYRAAHYVLGQVVPNDQEKECTEKLVAELQKLVAGFDELYPQVKKTREWELRNGLYRFQPLKNKQVCLEYSCLVYSVICPDSYKWYLEKNLQKMQSLTAPFAIFYDEARKFLEEAKKCIIEDEKGSMTSLYVNDIYDVEACSSSPTMPTVVGLNDELYRMAMQLEPVIGLNIGYLEFLKKIFKS